jgi:hypothetical protein
LEAWQYLGKTVTNKNFIHEKIKSRLNSGNVCYHSDQNLLPSYLLSKKLKMNIYKIIILPVLYGCEAWSLRLREVHRLKVFENTVLRKIFGSMREKVVGGWRRLHNKVLCNFYASQNIVRVIKSRWLWWMGNVAHMEEMRSAYKILAKNMKERYHLEDTHRWKDNIRMDVKEIG